MSTGLTSRCFPSETFPSETRLRFSELERGANIDGWRFCDCGQSSTVSASASLY